MLPDFSSLSNTQMILFFSVPLLYSIMLTIEFISAFSRVAGYILAKNAISYTLQNSVMATTRFFSMALLPTLGFLIDKDIDRGLYLSMVLISFFSTGVGSLIVLYFRLEIITFFYSLIENYSKTSRLVYSFYVSFRSDFKNNSIENYCNLKEVKPEFSIIFNTFIIYTVHSLGIFITFYLALLYPDNKVMITQTTGVINAIGTLLLTLKLEPMLSISIEKRSNYKELFFNIFITRVLIFMLISPSFFLMIYYFN